MCNLILRRGEVFMRKINTFPGPHLNMEIFSSFEGGLEKHTKKELSVQSSKEEN